MRISALRHSLYGKGHYQLYEEMLVVGFVSDSR